MSSYNDPDDAENSASVTRAPECVMCVCVCVVNEITRQRHSFRDTQD